MLERVGWTWTLQNDKGRFAFFGREAHSEYAFAAKAAHWLHRGDSVDREARCVLVDDFTASADEFSIDVVHMISIGAISQVDVIRVMESVERYEDGVKEVKRLLGGHPHSPLHKISSGLNARLRPALSFASRKYRFQKS